MTVTLKKRGGEEEEEECKSDSFHAWKRAIKTS
jgi:hypothetical protein